MTEAGTWTNILKPRLQEMIFDPVRVENVVGEGTPDVNYSRGWLETKEVPDWPKRAHTPLKVKFRRGQSAWLMRRWAAGGLAFLFVRVERDMLLFQGKDSLEVEHGLTQAQLFDRAVWRGLTGSSETDWISLKHVLLGGL